ncbi:hypothetical protein JW710_01730 [Candidatus Dojkabacteria bacterium]|nr:hypothetical protein [Candidatus Dojkabacteria bacterium]
MAKASEGELEALGTSVRDVSEALVLLNPENQESPEVIDAQCEYIAEKLEQAQAWLETPDFIEGCTADEYERIKPQCCFLLAIRTELESALEVGPDLVEDGRDLSISGMMRLFSGEDKAFYLSIVRTHVLSWREHDLIAKLKGISSNGGGGLSNSQARKFVAVNPEAEVLIDRLCDVDGETSKYQRVKAFQGLVMGEIEPVFQYPSVSILESARAENPERFRYLDLISDVKKGTHVGLVSVTSLKFFWLAAMCADADEAMLFVQEAQGFGQYTDIIGTVARNALQLLFQGEPDLEMIRAASLSLDAAFLLEHLNEDLVRGLINVAIKKFYGGDTDTSLEQVSSFRSLVLILAEEMWNVDSEALTLEEALMLVDKCHDTPDSQEWPESLRDPRAAVISIFLHDLTAYADWPEEDRTRLIEILYLMIEDNVLDPNVFMSSQEYDAEVQSYGDIPDRWFGAGPASALREIVTDVAGRLTEPFSIRKDSRKAEVLSSEDFFGEIFNLSEVRYDRDLLNPWAPLPETDSKTAKLLVEALRRYFLTKFAIGYKEQVEEHREFRFDGTYPLLMSDIIPLDLESMDRDEALWRVQEVNSTAARIFKGTFYDYLVQQAGPAAKAADVSREKFFELGSAMTGYPVELCLQLFTDVCGVVGIEVPDEIDEEKIAGLKAYIDMMYFCDDDILIPYLAPRSELHYEVMHALFGGDGNIVPLSTVRDEFASYDSVLAISQNVLARKASDDEILSIAGDVYRRVLVSIVRHTSDWSSSNLETAHQRGDFAREMVGKYLAGGVRLETELQQSIWEDYWYGYLPVEVLRAGGANTDFGYIPETRDYIREQSPAGLPKLEGAISALSEVADRLSDFSSAISLARDVTDLLHGSDGVGISAFPNLVGEAKQQVLDTFSPLFPGWAPRYVADLGAVLLSMNNEVQGRIVSGQVGVAELRQSIGEELSAALDKANSAWMTLCGFSNEGLTVVDLSINTGASPAEDFSSDTVEDSLFELVHQAGESIKDLDEAVDSHCVKAQLAAWKPGIEGEDLREMISTAVKVRDDLRGSGKVTRKLEVIDDEVLEERLSAWKDSLVSLLSDDTVRAAILSARNVGELVDAIEGKQTEVISRTMESGLDTLKMHPLFLPLRELNKKYGKAPVRRFVVALIGDKSFRKAKDDTLLIDILCNSQNERLSMDVVDLRTIDRRLDMLCALDFGRTDEAMELEMEREWLQGVQRRGGNGGNGGGKKGTRKRTSKKLRRAKDTADRFGLRVEDVTEDMPVAYYR